MVRHICGLLFAVLGIFCLGCGSNTLQATATPEPPKADSKISPLNPQKTLFLEVLPNGKRRLRLEAEVVMREGPLELLLCRRQTKEHEAILSADVDARTIHQALIVCGAKPGSPVKYQPAYVAASGSVIKIFLETTLNGKTETVPAQKWIRQSKNQKELEHDWVFAGSQLMPDPDDPKKPPYYTANSGDVICISNFVDAMLDLPIDSPKDNEALAFEANTLRIPPKGTKVTVILEVAEAVEKK